MGPAAQEYRCNAATRLLGAVADRDGRVSATAAEGHPCSQVRNNVDVLDRNRLRRSKFVLQPWCFELEYARAWRELDFPLYGLARPEPVDRRMGAKGRGGPTPRRPWRWLPPGLWTDLHHLGVIETGTVWRVSVDTRAGVHDWPAWMLEHGARHEARRHRFDGWDTTGAASSPHDVLVDGSIVSFDGVTVCGVWAGSATVGEVTVNVVAHGVAPTDLALSEITDPTPYLLKSP